MLYWTMLISVYLVQFALLLAKTEGVRQRHTGKITTTVWLVTSAVVATPLTLVLAYFARSNC
jgi:uncharacterized membrane protein YozB (DUF420 family)